MAELQLNFDETTLEASLYDLYSRLYEGMRAANQCELPDYMENPPLTDTGEIDVEAINAGIAEQNEVLMKNSAYMMASAIISSVGSGGSDSDSDSYVLRTGDSMSGALAALNGFKAGYANKLVFETSSDSKNDSVAYVYGHLNVSQGRLNISDDGIYFSDRQTIFYKDNAFQIQSSEIRVTGNLDIVGQLSVGSVKIKNNAILNDGNEYYHAGNSNLATMDWSMLNANVYGNLVVNGTSSCNGILMALKGFSLGGNNIQCLYSYQDQATSTMYVGVSTDLALFINKGIVNDGSHIIMIEEDAVSISAPNKIMRLGDVKGEDSTQYIALQTSIKNYSGDYDIITENGDGNFRNSFSAGCGNASSAVVATYFVDSEDCGVAFYRNIRIGGNNGPVIKSADTANIVFVMPYKHSDITEQIPFYISYHETKSLFRDQSKEWSSSLNYNTDAEFFVFQKPVESESFSIISEKYKTRLSENTLFFDDSVFIEGLTDGIRISKNTHFDNNLSSMQFASGFAGYGWAIIQSELVGGFTATFDELTVRKKMRVYEQEVQKHSITNGSLWVSDACSGDLVEEIF